MADAGTIIGATRDFIIAEFLPGEDPQELTEDFELITSGILDSLSRLKLVAFLEKTYDINFIHFVFFTCCNK